METCRLGALTGSGKTFPCRLEDGYVANVPLLTLSAALFSLLNRVFHPSVAGVCSGRAA